MGTLQQLNYPSMERQDLTQGQLGSFKFTPIDNPILDGTSQNNTLGDTPLLWHAQAKLRECLERQQGLEGVAWNPRTNLPQSAKNMVNRYHDSSFASALSYSSQPQSPNSLNDPTFFNKHIKPDLEDSRLKLGSAAFRSAVQSNSPDRNLIHQQGNEEQFPPQFLPFHPSLPRSRFLQPVMNPEASAFNPSVSSLDAGPNCATSLQKTLFLALVDEQDAHQETQNNLRDTVLKLEALEARLIQSQAENKSLLGAHKALRAIIQHNANRLQKYDDEAEKKQNPESAHPTSNLNNHTGSPKSIAVGAAVVANQDANVSPATRNIQDQEPAIVKQLSPGSDHSKLFNLDLLKNVHSADFDSACLSRTLRKHFSLDETSSAGTDIPNNGIESVSSINRLACIHPQSPAKQASIPEMDEITAPTKTAPKHGHVAKDYATAKLHTADDGLLRVPASFLNKYSAAKKHDYGEEKQEEVVFDTPHIGCDVSTGTRTKAWKAPSEEAEGYKACDIKIAPLDLSIKWKITKENPVYDEEDKAGALSSQLRGSHNQVFWRHPVRFLEHGENDKNIFRTVMIDYIPKEATYQDVLDQIRGGSLEKIEMVPAIGMSTDFKTARLVFNFELGASTTANYARDHGMVIKGKQVRVWQVITQTYPKNDQLDRDVFVDAFTRILVIDKATKEALDTIPDKLARLKSSIVECGETFDRFPMIEFTSVAAASAAMRILMSDNNFSGAVFDFEEDYCGEFGHDNFAMNDL